MTTWQYRIEELRLADKWGSKRQAEEFQRFRGAFNQIGSEGWELVSYQAVPMTGSYNTADVKAFAYIAIFKRQQQ